MDTSNKMVTVIVPVYNAQNTIEKTVESILQQQLENLELEVLLIDDGSKDNSFALCEQLANEHQEIRVIHTSNHGVAAARNRGMAEAKGAYLVFVDADDAISPDMIWKLYSAMTEQQAETACCGYVGVSEGVDTKQQYTPGVTSFAGQEEIRKGMLSIELVSPTIVGSCWAKMFLASVIQKNGIQFPEGISFGEDFCFCADYYSNCERLAFVNEPLYIYNMQQGSLYYSYHAKTSDMYTYLYKKKMEFFGENREGIRGVKTLYMERMLCCFEYTAQGNFDKQESLLLMKKILDNPVLQELIASGDYDVRSRYVQLLIKLYKKQKLKTIYHMSNIKVKLKNNKQGN